MSISYSTDFQTWIDETAKILRDQRWADLDLEHLIAEVEDLGKSERRGISSQLTRLLLHLLKWQYQPQRQSDSWVDSITDARTQIELAIADSPRLRAYPAEQLAECYHRACRQATQQTGLPPTTFPANCPHTLELILDDTWLPSKPE